MRHGCTNPERGHAVIELAAVLPLLILLALLTVDFGHLIQTRLIITNVSREGGSIGSRQIFIDESIVQLLAASGSPLELSGSDGKIVMTRVKAGDSDEEPNPSIETQLTTGALGVSPTTTTDQPTLGLSQDLHDRLVFDPDQGAPDITELTVVEVYYKYRPITPIPKFLAGKLLSDGDGTIISSRAVF